MASSSHAPRPAPPAAKVQHQRVAALASRGARSPVKSVAHVPTSAPIEQQAGPSRPRRSPVKPVVATSYDPKTPHPRDRASPPVVEHHAAVRNDPAPQQPQQAKGYPLPARRPEAKPLAATGRSVSHNILPTEATSTHQKLYDLNPLSNPGRPTLVQSYSTTALADAYTAPPPKPGRFATGPMRIVRPAPMLSADGHDGEQATLNVDGFFYTPSGATVLRGPTRPPPTIGHGRRPMGQAQRRFVTAPSATNGDVIIAKTPAANRVLTRTVRDKIDETDEQAISTSPAKDLLRPLPPSLSAQASDVSLSTKDAASRATPDVDEINIAKARDGVRKSLAMLAETPAIVPAELAAQIPLPVQSPQKHNHSEMDPSKELEIQAEEGRIVEQIAVAGAIEGDEGGVKGHDEKSAQLTETTASQEAKDPQTTLSEEPESPPKSLAHQVARKEAPESSTRVTPDVADVPTPSVIDPVVEPITTERHAPVAFPSAPIPIQNVSGTVSGIATTTTNKPRLEPRLPPGRANAARTLSGRRDKLPQPEASAPKAVTTAPPPPRKPPVPRAAAVARVAKPVDRKPFRPTTAAESAATRIASIKAASVARVPAVQTVKATDQSKPAEAAMRTRAPSTSASSTASHDHATAPTAKTEATATRVVKASTLHAPTKASSSRAAPTGMHSTQRIVSTGSANSGAASANTGASGINNTALPPVRKERIKLKAALPSFRPVRQAQTTPAAGAGPLQSKVTSGSPSTATSQATRSGGAKVKPESIPLPSSPASNSTTAIAAPAVVRRSSSSSQGSGRARVRPEHMPLPASPPHVADPSAPSVPTSNGPVESLGQASAPAPHLNELGLPLPPTRDRFESSRSKASDAPTASDDSDSGDDTDDTDDLEGVTFKPKQTARPPSRPRVIHNGNVDIENTITHSHTPNKPHMSDTTTPKYTPNRRALVFRDANVRSPLVSTSEQNESGEEMDRA